MTNIIVFWRTLFIINLSKKKKKEETKQESQFTLATETVCRELNLSHFHAHVLVKGGGGI